MKNLVIAGESTKRLAATAFLFFAAIVACGVSVQAQNQLPQTETTQQILRAIELANAKPQPGTTQPSTPRGPSKKEIESGITYRVVYCQQNPDGFVTVPDGEKIACAEELARVKASCTVNDPKFMKLQSCKAFVKKQPTP